MHRTRTGRTAFAALALIAVAAITAASAGATATAPTISVRIEGTTSTLRLPTSVTLKPGSVNSDGVAGHSCSSLTAAGAIELATHGSWKGTWSKSLRGYFISAVDGLALPATGAEYWAFWVNDAPASQGICGYKPKPGDSILFFPDCYGKKCPPNDGVLAVKAPATVTAGSPTTVTVTAYSDAAGKPSPKAGATVTGAGTSAKTAAGGAARITFTKPGRFWLEVSAPHTTRTEARICVRTATSNPCG